MTLRGLITNRPEYICLLLKSDQTNHHVQVLMGTGKRCAYGSTPSDGLEIIDNIMTASGRSGVVINIIVDMWP